MVEVSPTIISQVIESVYEQFVTWQSKPPDTFLYPIAHLDCIAVKVRQERSVI